MRRRRNRSLPPPTGRTLNGWTPRTPTIPSADLPEGMNPFRFDPLTNGIPVPLERPPEPGPPATGQQCEL